MWRGRGWSGVAKDVVYERSSSPGVQLILTYSWARSSILVAGYYLLSLLHQHTAFMFTVYPLCQRLFKLSLLHGAWEVLTTKFLSEGSQKTKLVATLKKFCGIHYCLVNPYNVAVFRIVYDVFASDEP